MGNGLRTATHLTLLPFRDLLGAMDRIATGKRPWLALLVMIAGAGAFWFLYVPVHELLHVAGCLVTGGSVSQVHLDPIYGARLLSRWFPFIQAGGDHAGRVTGFTTGRSDLTYMATVVAPYFLSVPGVALLRLASRHRIAVAAGVSLVLATAPFISLTGDYFEMGSILVTRSLTPLAAPPEPYTVTSGLMSLRSDDLPALLSRIAKEPDLSTSGITGGMFGVVLVVTLSFAMAAALALGTYAAGDFLARQLRLPPLGVNDA